MAPIKRPSASTEHFGVILLAAGYGTRLAADIAKDTQFSSMASIPKPLLPVGGEPILSHWLRTVSTLPAISSIVVVSNAAHYSLYCVWAEQIRGANSDTAGIPLSVISDGTRSNETRLGAIRAIDIGLNHVARKGAQRALIVAGDCLFPNVSIISHVEDFCKSEQHAAAFAYHLEDMSESHKRGMFWVEELRDGTVIAKQLIEKPKDTSNLTSDLASAPVYMLEKQCFDTVSTFLDRHRDQPLDKRDAPGLWLSWLISQTSVRVYTVEHRLDVGNLLQYKTALWTFTIPSQSPTASKLHDRLSYEPAVGRAYPRVGILGNPSDGFEGKVISASIVSEGYAEVVATENNKFVITPSPMNEFFIEFDDLNHMMRRADECGIGYSARPLVAAACIMFAKIYREYKSNGDEASVLNSLPGCELTYSSTIPPKIGLSGSSAFILATFRALARFYNTSLEAICPDIKIWADMMRKAETELLGIAGGRQDPIMALMQGAVLMDFTGGGLGNWERLDEKLLPDMWLCYHYSVGESSGKVHGNLRSRYSNGDQTIPIAVRQLIELVDKGKKALESGDDNRLPELFNRNFELRIELVGDTAIGDANKKLTSVAKEAGFAAKMTGSGGCALCIPNPVRKLSEEEILKAKTIFEGHELMFKKVHILESRPWLT
ncbi:Nucleotide-diphospho-sugar transferase [Gracilaria domingensis]|nr:Nucleotide-diphospho-sugar transferase [Gracilaria domingensis]